MRVLLVVAALFTGACSVETNGGAADSHGGYRLEVRASEAEQIYLVTAPDGRVAAARAQDGQSTLLGASDIRALAPPMARNTTAGDDNHTVSIHAPGFSLQASGDDEGKSDGGQAHLSMNAGGQSIEIDADSDTGDASDGRAHVVIAGADEKTARDFIAHADKLSPAVQAQMLSQVGL